ncbi:MULTISPECIES: single-stranded DNA-binding protein [unclassified Mycoplasma]|uniref:single-stranded DNA-binding protein n=1 Tax=unclassified Mycoplasma TaxID=2683645 RepID=UPI00211C4B04|nr:MULTISPECIES: single-stranded DNA-binding protein [unclassified Mycoplasma]UUM19591.1 single-stranded DNA-binding protein [Mycoplasma sp. 1578d]UUM24511.1 single-stranded DNA-binding protein [Mycoplasma sp. 3686d]
MYNKVILIGRIANIKELKQAQSGSNFVSFSVAVNKNTKSTPNDKANFIPCVAFKGNADFINKYLTKGSLVMIDGSISMSDYQDRNGNRNTSFDVIVNLITPLESKSRREELSQKNINNTQFSSRNEIPVQTPEQYLQLNKNNDYVLDQISDQPASSVMFDNEEDWE